jgi:SAM-dependent methyltransferase
MKFMARTYEVYQPVEADGTIFSGGKRDTLSRWESVRKAINEYDVQTVLDIGCAEGFFTLSAARECGCRATGVDGDARRLWFATQQALLNDIKNTCFMYGDIGEDLISSLPQYDMVIFLSVLHHYLAKDGYDKSLCTMRTLLGKTKKVMVFEMGSSLESLSLQLPDMGLDPDTWIKNFLVNAGAQQILEIARSPGYDVNISRTLYLVIP